MSRKKKLSYDPLEMEAYENHLKAKEMRQNGSTIVEIANKLDMSQDTVSRFLRNDRDCKFIKVNSWKRRKDAEVKRK